MRIICSKERLIKALSIAESVISTKIRISILSNVLIEAHGNLLKITSSETRLNFFTTIGAEVLVEGSAAVNCNKLYSIIRKMPEEDIDITVDEDYQFIIRQKDNKKLEYILKGIDSEKFPPISSIENVEFFSIPQVDFYDMVRKTIIAISVSESRRFVSGVFFTKDNNNIRMVGTDGRRLALVDKEFIISDNYKDGVIIPPKILNEITKLVSENGDIQIAFDEQFVYVCVDNYYFISNLLDATFPNYENVIPSDLDFSFYVDKSKIKDSLDRLSQISDKDSHKVVFEITNSSLEITTEDITHGSGKELVDIEYDGEPLKIALNYLYIIDFINVVNGEKIIFNFKDSQKTISIKEENNDEYLYIMMPMQC